MRRAAGPWFRNTLHRAEHLRSGKRDVTAGGKFAARIDHIREGPVQPCHDRRYAMDASKIERENGMEAEGSV